MLSSLIIFSRLIKFQFQSTITQIYFSFSKGIYPNNEERELLFGGGITIKMAASFLSAMFKQKKVNMKHNLDLPLNPMAMMAPVDDLNICSVFHELQPRADNMVDQIKFAGCFLNDEVRNFDITDENLKRIFDYFPPVNPIDPEQLSSNESTSSKKLVYASLGTVWNNRIDVFEKMINAIRTFDQETGKKDFHLKSTDLEVVISVGKEVYAIFQDKIAKEKYQLPENVLLQPFVPQIEILKRASLYITHCGMNSTSETIHYGVPVCFISIFIMKNLKILFQLFFQ
jgi:UDP:flavonoid glycosyltransferase YjiC (YdhE family)